MLQAREKSTESIEYLEKAMSVYKMQGPESRTGPQLIGEDWLQGSRDKLEANLTQTYFYCAQVYSKANQAEKGIEYSCKTMQRQLETNTH